MTCLYSNGSFEKIEKLKYFRKDTESSISTDNICASDLMLFEIFVQDMNTSHSFGMYQVFFNVFESDSILNFILDVIGMGIESA